MTSNAGKVHDADPSAEVQGTMVRATEHWVGVSREKRYSLMTALVWPSVRRRVMVVMVDQVVGKLGFCHAYRALLRSVFQHSYRWLQDMHARTQHRALSFGRSSSPRLSCCLLHSSTWTGLTASVWSTVTLRQVAMDELMPI